MQMNMQVIGILVVGLLSLAVFVWDQTNTPRSGEFVEKSHTHSHGDHIHVHADAHGHSHSHDDPMVSNTLRITDWGIQEIGGVRVRLVESKDPEQAVVKYWITVLDGREPSEVHVVFLDPNEENHTLLKAHLQTKGMYLAQIDQQQGQTPQFSNIELKLFWPDQSVSIFDFAD